MLHVDLNIDNGTLKIKTIFHMCMRHMWNRQVKGQKDINAHVAGQKDTNAQVKGQETIIW